MTTTTKYFATCDANGLIGAELQSENLNDARRELAAAVADHSATAWIDDAQTDLEDACGVSCDGLDYSDATARCADAGAECEVDCGTNDGWSIWSVTTDN